MTMDTTDREPKVTLGDLLKRARRDAGLDQRQLAQRIGRSPAVISKWELDYSEPSFGDMRRIIHATGADWLLTEPFRGAVAPTQCYATRCDDVDIAA